MKFILAGNYHEYRKYLRETGESPRESVFLSDVFQMKGIVNPIVIRYGNWTSNSVSFLDEVEEIERLMTR